MIHRSSREKMKYSLLPNLYFVFLSFFSFFHSFSFFFSFSFFLWFDIFPSFVHALPFYLSSLICHFSHSISLFLFFFSFFLSFILINSEGWGHMSSRANACAFGIKTLACKLVHPSATRENPCFYLDISL